MKLAQNNFGFTVLFAHLFDAELKKGFCIFRKYFIFINFCLLFEKWISDYDYLSCEQLLMIYV